MALREFRDSKGVSWKVWSVTPDSLDKRTTAEDYMRDWQDGWLCFECPDSRRRLATFPPGWEDLPDDELEALMARAQVVKRRGSEETTGEFRKSPDAAPNVMAVPVSASQQPSTPQASPAFEGSQSRPDAGRMTPPSSQAMHSRIFSDSRGRKFVAGLYRVAPRAEPGSDKIPTSAGTVLRFISGSIVLDLADWPDDWYRYTDTQMARLLDRAQPVDTLSVADSLPLRRQTDIPG